MDNECDSCPMSICQSIIVHSAIPRVVRLSLAVFIALVALVCLCDRLSAARRQAIASYTVATEKPTDGSKCEFCITAQHVHTRCPCPALNPVKRIEPSNPNTGDVVTITFVITGLGLKPLDVILLHDVSGSMSETDTPSRQTRLKVAQGAAITFVEALSNAGNRVAIVAYSETVRFTPTLPLTMNVNAIASAIYSLTAGGNTNISAAIHSGYQELILSDQYLPRTVKAMVLLSDGRANCPGSVRQAEKAALAEAEKAGACGILIYTIGLGDPANINEDLLRTIAHTTGGEYRHSSVADLGKAYQEIALELRNLVITDVLPPGVDLDCDLLPDDWGCITGSGYTTVTIPISNNRIMTGDSWTGSFTTTVNLDPPREYLVNAAGSETCYDGPVVTPCEKFDNPTVTVGGRKVTGVVFEDLNLNGEWDKDEEERGLPDQVISTSTKISARTNFTGFYVLRTAEDPPLTITVKPPPGFIVTTPPTVISAISGTYPGFDIGLYTGLFPEKHSKDINGPPLFEGDTLVYTMTVRNISVTQECGFIVITDAIPSFTTYVSGTKQIVPTGTISIADSTLMAFYTGTLASESGITVTFRVTVDEGSVGEEVSNQVCMTSTARSCPLSQWDEEGPYLVESVPTLLLDLATSAKVLRPETRFLYVYTVSQNSPNATLNNIVVTDSLIGPISPTGFSLPPTESQQVLIVPFSLTQNATNIATVTAGVEGYSGLITGGPATTTVHVIQGISLNRPYTRANPMYYHGDSTTLYYSVTNQDIDDGVTVDDILITDPPSHSFAFTTPSFHLHPCSSSRLFSRSFTVPRDITVTLIATGTDGIEHTLLLSDQVSLPLCPEDIYEREDIYRDDEQPPKQCNTPHLVSVSPHEPPQLHDFSNGEDKDWACFSIQSPNTLYTFVAHPLTPAGVAITLTLIDAGSNEIIRSADNLSDPTSDVRFSAWLPSEPGSYLRHLLTTYDYHLLVKPANERGGCWTDYELWVEESHHKILLPLVLRDL